MTVRRAIEVKVFKGKRVFKRSGNTRLLAVASGTGTSPFAGTITWSSATGSCYLAIDTAGTGTKINA
jgi:hypothetical protein